MRGVFRNVAGFSDSRQRLSLTIRKPNIRLRSPYPDASKTTIVFDKSAGTAGGTLNSATVNVTEDNFVAENLTFVNDYNATHPQLQQGSQALALLVTGDRAVFRNVRLLGNQDTLYAGSKDCNPADGRPTSPTMAQTLVVPRSRPTSTLSGFFTTAHPPLYDKLEIPKSKFYLNYT